MTEYFITILLAFLCAVNVALYLTQGHGWASLAAAVFIGILALSRRR